MKILLTLFVMFFSSSVFADDISDFEIEGMSIGDSLLDYMSEEEIKKEIEDNRYMYKYLSDKFGEVFYYDGLQTYKLISFMVKPDDKRFIIYSIRGQIDFIENLNACLKKLNEISEEFSDIFPEAKKIKLNSFKHPVDPTGRSTVHMTEFIFKSGDGIRVWCTKYEESLRIKNNWTEGLSVGIDRKEVSDWGSDY